MVLSACYGAPRDLPLYAELGLSAECTFILGKKKATSGAVMLPNGVYCITVCWGFFKNKIKKERGKKNSEIENKKKLKMLYI